MFLQTKPDSLIRVLPCITLGKPLSTLAGVPYNYISSRKIVYEFRDDDSPYWKKILKLEGRGWGTIPVGLLPTFIQVAPWEPEEIKQIMLALYKNGNLKDWVKPIELFLTVVDGIDDYIAAAQQVGLRCQLAE